MTLCKVSESIKLKPREGFPREHKNIEGDWYFLRYNYVLIQSFSFETLKRIIQIIPNFNFRLHNSMPFQFTKSDLNKYEIKLDNLELCKTIEPIFCIQKLDLTSNEIDMVLGHSASIRVIGKKRIESEGFYGILWKSLDLSVSEIYEANRDKIKDLILDPSVEFATLDVDIITLERRIFSDHTSFDIRTFDYEALIENQNVKNNNIFIENLLISGSNKQFLIDNLETIFYEDEFNCLNIFNSDLSALLLHIDFRLKELYIQFETNSEICEFVNETTYKFSFFANTNILTLNTNISQSDSLDISLIIDMAKDFIENVD